METDASGKGLGAILSQYQEDNRLHPVAYASRSVTKTEANYAITDLETLVVVWVVTHFHYYLYGHKVTIIIDHAAVRAIEAPNLSGKHARWWSKVYGSGIKEVEIVHHPGKKNAPADCLSRQPVLSAPADKDFDTGTEANPQIVHISSKLETVSALLQQEPTELVDMRDGNTFPRQQMEDEELLPIIMYLLEGTLPADKKAATDIT